MDSRKVFRLRTRLGGAVWLKGIGGMGDMWIYMSEDECREVCQRFDLTPQPVDMQGPVATSAHCECIFPQGAAALYLALELEYGHGPTLTTI